MISQAELSQPQSAAPLDQNNRLVRWLRVVIQWLFPAKRVLLWPAILIVLFLSIFPLVASLGLSFTRLKLVRGGYELTFIGLQNYQQWLLGTAQRNLLGRFSQPSLLGWILGITFTGFMLYWFYNYLQSPRFILKSLPISGETPLQTLWRIIAGVLGLLLRIVAVIFASALVWLMVVTLSNDGLPGGLVVTLIFVLGGVTVQYLIGLGLALLVTQNLPGKRFFRVIFLLPMMITPVGIAFLFRMVTDTFQGPFAPVWKAVGLGDFAWINSPDLSRIAVIIADTWQWTPLMFIILLAALEGTSREQIEAALVDGASRLQMFQFIMLPQIAPVSLTVILIRLIEAFKIIDMPNVMTGGAPGTATESMTLQLYKIWKASNFNFGPSAALAYILLIVVTFVSIMYVNTIRQRVMERL